MNNSSNLVISYQAPETRVAAPLKLSLPLNKSSFLQGPSGCGKSTLFRDLASYAEALETDITHILNHRLTAAQKKPKGLKLSCLPTLLLLSPETLDSMPTTLDALWEIRQRLSAQAPEEPNHCPRCSGSVQAVPEHEWESEIFRRYEDKLVALCLPCDRDSNTWPPDGKILIENTIYSLEQDEERYEAVSLASSGSLPCLIYDRLRIRKTILPRIQTAIREALNLESPALRIFELNASPHDSTWMSRQSRCVRCGTMIQEGTVTIDGSLRLGELVQTFDGIPYITRLLQRACSFGFSDLALDTRLKELSYGKRLILSLLHTHSTSLILIDGLSSILSFEEEGSLHELLREREDHNRASIVIDSRCAHPDAITLPLPQRHALNTRAIADIQLPRRKAFVSTSPTLLFENPELKRGMHYHISAFQEGATLYYHLLQKLQDTKDSHKLSVLSHKPQTPVNQRSRSILEFLGLHKVLEKHLASSIEAKTRGLQASEISKTPAATTIQFLGKTFRDYEQMPIKEAASILSSIPAAGPCLSLLDSLLPGTMKLSCKIQTLSSSEYQKLSMLRLLYSRLSPYVVFLEYPAWGLDEENIEIMRELFLRLTNTGTTIITLDSYPWAPCLLQA